MKCLLIICLISVIGLACSASTEKPSAQVQPSPSPSPAVSPSPPLSAQGELAKEESNFQDGVSYEELGEARQAAVEWAKAQYPGWEVKGVSCQEQSSATFFVDVDLYKNKESQVARLFVESMFSDNRTYYWKTVPLTQALQERTLLINYKHALETRVVYSLPSND